MNAILQKVGLEGLLALIALLAFVSAVVAVQAAWRGYPVLPWLLAGLLGDPVFLLVVLGILPDLARLRLRQKELDEVHRRIREAGQAPAAREEPGPFPEWSLGDLPTNLPERSLGDLPTDLPGRLLGDEETRD